MKDLIGGDPGEPGEPGEPGKPGKLGESNTTVPTGVNSKNLSNVINTPLASKQVETKALVVNEAARNAPGNAPRNAPGNAPRNAPGNESREKNATATSNAREATAPNLSQTEIRKQGNNEEVRQTNEEIRLSLENKGNNKGKNECGACSIL